MILNVCNPNFYKSHKSATAKDLSNPSSEHYINKKRTPLRTTGFVRMAFTAKMKLDSKEILKPAFLQQYFVIVYVILRPVGCL